MARLFGLVKHLVRRFTVWAGRLSLSLSLSLSRSLSLSLSVTRLLSVMCARPGDWLGVEALGFAQGYLAHKKQPPPRTLQ